MFVKFCSSGCNILIIYSLVTYSLLTRAISIRRKFEISCLVFQLKVQVGYEFQKSLFFKDFGGFPILTLIKCTLASLSNILYLMNYKVLYITV